MELSLSDLDFNESGEWPLPAKGAVIGLLCLAIWIGGYFLIIKDKQTKLAGIEKKEQELKLEFQEKQAKVANFEAYKVQLAEMNEMFLAMLEQLPRKKEVADLLVDISRTGVINGLEFELFKPENEQPRDFYAELPISMAVTGNYHQFGQFVSGIASLPRIVTIHDLELTPPNKDTGKMMMEVTAKTYRYFDETEEQDKEEQND